MAYQSLKSIHYRKLLIFQNQKKTTNLRVKTWGDTYPYPPGIYALGSRKHNSVSNISCYGVGDLSFFYDGAICCVLVHILMKFCLKYIQHNHFW